MKKIILGITIIILLFILIFIYINNKNITNDNYSNKLPEPKNIELTKDSTF